MIASIVACLIVAELKPKRPVAPKALNLVPTPVRVTRPKGRFQFTHNTNIVFSDQFPEDRFAAEQLMEEVLTDLGERIEPVQKQAPHAISLIRLNGPISPEDHGQGYKLDVTPQSITVSASTSEGIFYGVQTLKQLIRANRTLNTIPACHIVDWPTLKYRGWQHDISRGPIPTYGFLMKEIRTLSEFKLNMLTLYTEHVFKLKKHPEIAPADGITADEIAELSSYAKQFHVEVVGNFQSFGHFGNILKVPGYENLAETPRVLTPAKDESYKFLSDVFAEIAPAYSSPYFNINCDEVSGLGTGPSKDLVKEYGVGGVYARHINRVVGLLRRYGKTPMMWGDIALHYPEIVPKLPKDLIVLPWAYSPAANFDNQILPFTKFGLQFMVCPGVSCWGQVWPDLGRATVNISNFIRDGAKYGALGSLNTSWDDDGINFFDDNWYAFTWGAECSWRPAAPTKLLDPEKTRLSRLTRFNRAFSSVFFGIKGRVVTDAMIKLSALRDNPISGGMKNAAFWRDPVTTFSKLPNPQDVPTFQSDCRTIIDTLIKAKSEATHNAPTLDYAVYAARRAKFLGDSMAAAEALQRFDQASLRSVEKEVTDLRDMYADLWQRENQSWWLDKNIAKFDDLSGRIRKLLK